MRFSKHDSLWFSISLVLLGIAVGVIGYARSSASFTETSGIITQTALASGQYGPGPRILSYAYTVAGKKYSGEGSVRYTPRQDDALQLGRGIRVFYERAHPHVSYPLYPPSRLPWVGGAIFIVAFGGIAIFWGWRH
jgi:hypothetical protein